jgi:hypothetical protein
MITATNSVVAFVAKPKHSAKTTTISARKSSTQNSSPQPERAALKVQQLWRGFVIRRELKRVLFGHKLSGSAIQHCLDLVVEWHTGWMKLGALGFLLVFFIVTVNFQVFSGLPLAADSDQSLFRRMSGMVI